MTSREPIPTNAPDLLAALVDLTQLVSSGYPRDDIAMQRSLRDACAVIRIALGETAERPLARDLRAVAVETKSRSAINQPDPEIARWRAQANHYEQHMLHGTVCAHDIASVWNGIRHDDPDDQSWCDGSGTRLCGNPDCDFLAAFSGLAGSTVPTCPECDREVGVAFGSVFRGKGDNTAYCADARRPIICPWCSKPDRSVYLHIAKVAES